MTEKERKVLIYEKEFFLLLNSEKIGKRGEEKNENLRTKCTNSSKQTRLG